MDLLKYSSRHPYMSFPFTLFEIQIYELFTMELGSDTNSFMPHALITLVV